MGLEYEFPRLWKNVFRSSASYHALFPAGRVVRSMDVSGRTPCQLGMYIWHVMFGEPLRMQRREHTPEVPLFMRMQSVEVEALDSEQEQGQYDEEMLEQMFSHGASIE